jgi:hypothetical protein
MEPAVASLEPAPAGGEVQGWALNVFCSHGAVPIDNNVSEREMKRVVLNRKNSLFVGNARGGRTAAILASTCRRHDVDPQLYLTQLLINLPTLLISKPPQWLPDQWKIHHTACKGLTRESHNRCGSDSAHFIIANKPEYDSESQGRTCQCCNHTRRGLIEIENDKPAVTLHSNPGIALPCFQLFPGFKYMGFLRRNSSAVLKGRKKFRSKFVRLLSAQTDISRLSAARAVRSLSARPLRNSGITVQ